MVFVSNYECTDFSVIVLRIDPFVFRKGEKKEWNLINLVLLIWKA